jgi:phage shock protein PspC (stress-responsive transcriptional regulator)
MNKVIAINLNGNAYQLEEDGYEALRAYLESASRQLEVNPDRAEIIADIEQSIADKFRGFLGVNKTVVVAKEVRDVISEMGPVQDPSDSGASPAGAAPSSSGSAPSAEPAAAAAPKRLYRIRDGARVGGVCNGLAAYFDIDVTLLRILFAFAVVFWGTGLALYVIMWLVVPVAETPAEKAAASGVPSTAEDFIRRAREGYYGGMKAFSDRRAFREWKRTFKREMRQHGRALRWEMRFGGPPGAPPPHPDSWLAHGVFRFLTVIACLLFAAAVISLLLHGAVFGLLIPAGVPTWIGILFLFLVFKAVTCPLKAMRRSYYPYCGGGCGGGFFGVLLWIASIWLLVWILSHHYHGVDETLDGLRQVAHRAVDAVRSWWDGH